MKPDPRPHLRLVNEFPEQGLFTGVRHIKQTNDLHDQFRLAPVEVAPEAVRLPVDPFAGSSGGPTRLEIEFEGAGRVYRYVAELTRQTVIEERLSFRNPASKSFRTLLRRQAGFSHVRLLCDLKGMRREENFFANYNAGRYEAIPEPERF